MFRKMAKFKGRQFLNQGEVTLQNYVLLNFSMWPMFVHIFKESQNCRSSHHKIYLIWYIFRKKAKFKRRQLPALFPLLTKFSKSIFLKGIKSCQWTYSTGDSCWGWKVCRVRCAIEKNTWRKSSSQIHCASDTLGFLYWWCTKLYTTKMSLNQKRKISATGRIRLRIPVEYGK